MTIMRAIMRLGFVALAAIFLASIAAPAWAQSGFDRPGGDYLSFQVRSGDPAECAARCDRDGRCRAWSFVYPNPRRDGRGVLAQAARPERVQSACCVSGVRGGGVVEPRKPQRRIRHRSLRRRYARTRRRDGPERRDLRQGLHGREGLPRLDLCAARATRAAPRVATSRTASRRRARSRAVISARGIRLV